MPAQPEAPPGCAGPADLHAAPPAPSASPLAAPIAAPIAAPDARPLRILHIGKFYPPDRGGIETYLADLITQQRASGMDARALVHGQPQPGDPYWLQRLPVHIRLIFTPISLGFARAIGHSLKTFQPDVLHLHMPNVAVFWLLALGRRARRVPWVVHWHSDVTFTREQTALALAYRLYRPLEHKILAQAHFIIATSPPYLQASATLRPWLDKCVAIPLGLQAQAPQAPIDATADAADAASDPSWSANRLRIVSIGRLTYYKGFETLVRAVANLPHAQLRIVGEGDLRAPLQALIDDLRRQGQPADVQLLGSVDEPRKHALLAQCDVFALASRERTEAFGLALVEAMQFGKPCVVSDLHGSGMPWLIRQSGAGLCVPMDDVPAWQQALERLRADPPARQRLGQAGRVAAQQLFSIGANSRHVHTLYSSLTPEVPERRPARRALALVLPLRHLPAPAELDALATHLSRIAPGAPGRHATLVLVNEATHERPAMQRLSQWALQWRARTDTARTAPACNAVAIHTPYSANRLGALQTGMRWALRQGHEQLLHIPAELAWDRNAWPALDAAIAALLQRAAPPSPAAAPEALLAIPADQHRRARRWALAPYFSRSVQLYQRSAMQKVHHMRLSLLDQPEMGLLLMARQAGLDLHTLPLPELAQRPRPSLLARLRFALSASLMYLAKRRRRSPSPHPATPSPLPQENQSKEN